MAPCSPGSLATRRGRPSAWQEPRSGRRGADLSSPSCTTARTSAKWPPGHASLPFWATCPPLYLLNARPWQARFRLRGPNRRVFVRFWSAGSTRCSRRTSAFFLRGAGSAGACTKACGAGHSTHPTPLTHSPPRVPTMLRHGAPSRLEHAGEARSRGASSRARRDISFDDCMMRVRAEEVPITPPLQRWGVGASFEFPQGGSLG